jgi:hypothetical protein
VTFVLRVLEKVGQQIRPGDPRGMYVLSCDVNAHDGYGEVHLTMDRREAMRFTDAAEAWRYYRRVSRVRPVRADGQPNRPLTAYMVEAHDVDAEPLDIDLS